MSKTIHANKKLFGRKIRAAAAEPITLGVSESKAKPFSILAYTGGPLYVDGFDLPIIVDLANLKQRSQIIANLDHETTQRVGQVDEVINDGRTIKMRGIANAATPYRDEVIASAQDNFKWQASIEATPLQIETISAGVRVEVNGQSFEGPVYVSRETELTGVAFVGQGADDNTSARIAAAAASSTLKGNDMGFEEWLAAKGFDITTLSEDQIATLKMAHQAEIQASATEEEKKLEAMPEEDKKLEASADEDKLMASDKYDIDELKAGYARLEASIEAELFRANGIVPDDKLKAIKAQAYSDAVKIKANALNKKQTGSQFAVAATRQLGDLKVALIRAERPVGPAIHASSRDVNNLVIEAAMAKTLKIPDVEKQYKEQHLESADKNFRRGITLQQMMIMAASQNGMVFSPGERIHQGNLREALHYTFNPIRAASTLSLPGIFSNIANKELLAGYQEEDQTWREIADVKSVNDFKLVTSYRLLDNMEYEELASDGTIPRGTMGEETYTRSVDTFAKMFSLTRKDIINDDLSAFDDIRNRLGRGGAQRFNRLFWSRFINNAAFFTAGRGNFISGATTNLGTDGVGLGLGVAAFRRLQSPAADGARRIGGNPDRLLVPPELEHVADKLYMGEKLNIGSGPGEDNIYRNKYRPIPCVWLSDPQFVGNSAAFWYLFRDPAILASIVVSFLNGNETPTVESADADFDRLGVDFRGYHDFGVDLAEYLAGIKSKAAV
jgi:Spy/CpxP family protein refolding chaperone